MRMRTLLPAALTVLILVTAVGHALLLPITLEEFSSAMDCAAQVKVVETFQILEKPLPPVGPDDTFSWFDSAALLRTVDVFPLGTCEHEMPQEIQMVFSTEVHSSHPQSGDRALVFLELGPNGWTESVYGRSFWRLSSSEEGEAVEITWRNRFLLTLSSDSAQHLEPGEIRYVPLAQVTDALF